MSLVEQIFGIPYDFKAGPVPLGVLADGSRPQAANCIHGLQLANRYFRSVLVPESDLLCPQAFYNPRNPLLVHGPLPTEEFFDLLESFGPKAFGATVFAQYTKDRLGNDVRQKRPESFSSFTEYTMALHRAFYIGGRTNHDALLRLDPGLRPLLESFGDETKLIFDISRVRGQSGFVDSRTFSRFHLPIRARAAPQGTSLDQYLADVRLFMPRKRNLPQAACYFNLG